jgi:hypothetical protein
MSAAPLVAGTTTTLVVGATAAAREAAIAAELAQPHGISAVILEGLAPGNSPLDTNPPDLPLARIAPACMCCAGNLVLRVTLNRLLRQRPERLFIGVAQSEHLDQLRSWLQTRPYDQLLLLTPDLTA